MKGHGGESLWRAAEEDYSYKSHIGPRLLMHNLRSVNNPSIQRDARITLNNNCVKPYDKLVERSIMRKQCTLFAR